LADAKPTFVKMLMSSVIADKKLNLSLFFVPNGIFAGSAVVATPFTENPVTW
jgi:hypothetical protein